MKTMKKIFALALALMLVMSLAVTASAAVNDSITINNAKEGETYEIYKLFDLVVDDEEAPSKYSYTVNADWEAFFEGDGAQYVTINDEGYVTAISDAAALAKAAANWTSKPAALDSIKADATSVAFDGLENGYYLITSTLGTVAMTETTPDNSAVVITEKNPVDSITKTVKEDSTDVYGESNDAQIGDTVEFKSVITLNQGGASNKGTRKVTVTDTMDSGLTLNQNSIAIEGLTKDTDYTVTTSANGFVITFKQTYLDALTAQTTLNLTYTAVLNENVIANKAIVDQNNEIVIRYGDAQSVTAQTTTTTHYITVNKYAQSVDDLAGAVFSLKKDGTVVNLVKIDDNNYRVAMSGETGVTTFTTVDNGDIVIWGLDNDEGYTLVETAPPAGYNQLKDEVVVEDVDTVIDVLNNAGTELPSTGGIGTTLFYVFGGILMAAAAVLLVTKRRMSTAE